MILLCLLKLRPTHRHVSLTVDIVVCIANDHSTDVLLIVPIGNVTVAFQCCGLCNFFSMCTIYLSIFVFIGFIILLYYISFHLLAFMYASLCLFVSVLPDEDNC